MKLTNGEIFNAKESLDKLLIERMPVKVSYELAKLAHKLSDQYQVISRVRDGLFKTYGETNPSNPQQVRCLSMIVETDAEGQMVKDAKGLPHMIDNPVDPKFKSEMSELMEQDIEIVFQVVKLPETLEISPTVLMALEKFITI